MIPEVGTPKLVEKSIALYTGIAAFLCFGFFFIPAFFAVYGNIEDNSLNVPSTGHTCG